MGACESKANKQKRRQADFQVRTLATSTKTQTDRTPRPSDPRGKTHVTTLALHTATEQGWQVAPPITPIPTTVAPRRSSANDGVSSSTNDGLSSSTNDGVYLPAKPSTASTASASVGSIDLREEIVGGWHLREKSGGSQGSGGTDKSKPSDAVSPTSSCYSSPPVSFESRDVHGFGCGELVLLPPPAVDAKDGDKLGSPPFVTSSGDLKKIRQRRVQRKTSKGEDDLSDAPWKVVDAVEKETQVKKRKKTRSPILQSSSVTTLARPSSSQGLASLSNPAAIAVRARSNTSSRGSSTDSSPASLRVPARRLHHHLSGYGSDRSGGGGGGYGSDRENGKPARPSSRATTSSTASDRDTPPTKQLDSLVCAAGGPAVVVPEPSAAAAAAAAVGTAGSASANGLGLSTPSPANKKIGPVETANASGEAGN